VAEKLQGGIWWQSRLRRRRGKETIFMCPKYDAEHAFPGDKVSEPPMFPNCAIFLKAE
jgi:hypothetical protein